MCRTFSRRRISTTTWRLGASGLQAGPSCSSASSWPCESSTHWVNAVAAKQRARLSPPCVCWSYCLFCACSGLGSSSQGTGVRGAEDLCSVRRLLAVSDHYWSRLAVLQAVSGGSSLRTSFPSSVSHPLRICSQEKWVSSQLLVSDDIH